MTDDLASAKRATLSLLGGVWPAREPSPGEWRLIATLAAAHRLAPMLAWRAERAAWPVPESIFAAWMQARRDAALATLAQQAALRVALQALGRAAIPTVALKGVALAWRHYPEPGLRPMRDIDLLVAPWQALAAMAALDEAGFVASVTDRAVLDDALAKDHQLPAQTHSALGVTIELHHRLNDPPGKRGYRVPQLDGAAMMARAEPLDCGGFSVPVPATADLAAHLIVHAAYGHRLDCGPLVLADLHFLGADAVGVASRTAKAQGWDRGADLLAALTGYWMEGRPETPVPRPILAAAADALLGDPAGRSRSEAAADLGKLGAAALPQLARRLRPDREIVAREGGGMPPWAFWPVWALGRTVRALRRAGNRRIAHEARSAAQVMRWLDQPPAQFRAD